MVVVNLPMGLSGIKMCSSAFMIGKDTVAVAKAGTRISSDAFNLLFFD